MEGGEISLLGPRIYYKRENRSRSDKTHQVSVNYNKKRDSTITIPSPLVECNLLADYILVVVLQRQIAVFNWVEYYIQFAIKTVQKGCQYRSYPLGCYAERIEEGSNKERSAIILILILLNRTGTIGIDGKCTR